MVQSLSPVGGTRFLLRVRENSLTHVFDPCWRWGRRLPAEVKNPAVLVGGSKIGSEKPPENRANANLGKLNTKWS
jgi:hypothetical protein